MFLLHKLDQLLERRIWMRLKVLDNGGFDAFPEGMGRVPIKRNRFLNN